MASQKIKLEICGSSYVVSTSDSEEYLFGLAERLDSDMNQVMLESPNASVAAAAVMTALTYLDEAEKSAFGADNMRSQIQGYLEDASRARMDAEEARRELAHLRNEVAHYEARERQGKTTNQQAAPKAPADTKSASTGKDNKDQDQLELGD